MSLKVRQFEGKWRIGIHNEEWEFEDDVEMKEVFDEIVAFKKKFGQLNKNNKTNKKNR